MTYYFDMDGPIADLYGVENWLNFLKNESPYPYATAKPLVNPEIFCTAALKLKIHGINFGIISWTAKNGTKSYNKAVREAKRAWLDRYFPEIFTEIHIVKYGTPKSSVVSIQNGILFDDEEKNRTEWNGTAYDVNNIIEVLKSVA